MCFRPLLEPSSSRRRVEVLEDLLEDAMKQFWTEAKSVTRADLQLVPQPWRKRRTAPSPTTTPPRRIARVVRRRRRGQGLGVLVDRQSVQRVRAGLLALPHGFAQSGWSVAIAMLALSGAASCFTLHLLTLCGRSAPARSVVLHARAPGVPGRDVLGRRRVRHPQLLRARVQLPHRLRRLFPTALADLVNPQSEALPGALRAARRGGSRSPCSP